MSPPKPPAPALFPISLPRFLTYAAAIVAGAWLVTSLLLLVLVAHKYELSANMLSPLARAALMGPYVYLFLHLYQSVHESGHVIAARCAGFTPEFIMLGTWRHVTLPFFVFGAPVHIGLRWGGYASLPAVVYEVEGMRRTFIAVAGPVTGIFFACCLCVFGWYGRFGEQIEWVLICSGSAAIAGELYNLSGITPGTDGRFIWPWFNDGK